MNRMLPLEFAILLQFKFWSAFGNADLCPVIALSAILTFQPYIFSFTFLCHTILLSRLSFN